MLIEKNYSIFANFLNKMWIHKQYLFLKEFIDLDRTPLVDMSNITTVADADFLLEPFNCNFNEIELPFEDAYYKLNSDLDLFMYFKRYVYKGELSYIAIIEIYPGKFVLLSDLSCFPINFDDYGEELEKVCRACLFIFLKGCQVLTPQKTFLYKTNPIKIRLQKTNKKHYNIEKPIYIFCDEKTTSKIISNYAKTYGPLERSISWYVRGHWRKLDNRYKRGKNAQGEYVIEGYTWVKPCIKGNRDMKPREKTYIALK